MSDGTLQTLDVSMLDDVNNASGLIQLDSNAKIPACSGAAVTNLPGVTKSASDPAYATNPSGGVGSVWQNTTSGEMFICTDATAGANVWTNIGAGSGDIQPWQWGGETSGFLAGGHTASNNTIQKFSFVSDANATDLADTANIRSYAGGIASPTHGYVAGGSAWPGSEVEKYAFVSTANSVDIGDMTDGIRQCAGTADGTYVWWASSNIPAGGGNICKHTFSNDSFASTSSNFATAKSSVVGAYASSTYGYYAGGHDNNSTTGRLIEKVQFSSDTVSTSVTTMYQGGYGMAGAASSTHGYVQGGNCSGCGGTGNWIQKRSFASEGAMTDVGDSTTTHESGGGLSSTTYGYHAGGGPYQNTIDKFSFAADGNATDVGDLVVSISKPAEANY